MTNIELQTKLQQYPDDWPVCLELDDWNDQGYSKHTWLENSNLFVGTNHTQTEVLIHNDPTYQQPQTSK